VCCCFIVAAAAYDAQQVPRQQRKALRRKIFVAAAQFVLVAGCVILCDLRQGDTQPLAKARSGFVELTMLIKHHDAVT
jgi:hypothetical protein